MKPREPNARQRAALADLKAYIQASVSGEYPPELRERVRRAFPEVLPLSPGPVARPRGRNSRRTHPQRKGNRDDL